MYDGEGRLAGEAALRQRAFYGGIEPEARPEAWKFLLGVHSAGVTLAEREEAADQRLKRYITLRRQWKTIGADQEGRNSKWRERKGRVDKDVRRTGGPCQLLCYKGWELLMPLHVSLPVCMACWQRLPAQLPLPPVIYHVSSAGIHGCGLGCVLPVQTAGTNFSPKRALQPTPCCATCCSPT